MQRRGSLKGNKANTRDRSNDNLGNGNRKSFVLQSQGKTAREEGVKQSGAFYTLNKAGDKTPGAESRKVPVGVVHNARGNNIKNLGEKDVRKDNEGMRDNILGTTKEKVQWILIDMGFIHDFYSLIY